jgi:hypothetical protein
MARLRLEQRPDRRRNVQRERQNVSHVGIELDLGIDAMAEDGFHPGEPVYRACGEALALHIATTVWPLLEAQAGH